MREEYIYNVYCDGYMYAHNVGCSAVCEMIKYRLEWEEELEDKERIPSEVTFKIVRKARTIKEDSNKNED